MSVGLTERAANGVRTAWLAEGRVFDLCLDEPKGNVLSTEMMTAIRAALHEAEKRTDLHMVLLRAAGNHFSFGASVEEHRRDQAAAMLASFHQLIREVATFPVPVVALVQGRCLGGAFELVLACHEVLASDNAVFACPEIKLGVFPPVLAAIGPTRLGAAWTERLLLTGGDLSAAQAQALGWVGGALSLEEPLVEQGLAWHQAHLAGLSAQALRQGVKASRRGMRTQLGEVLDDLETQYVREVVESHDGNEGIEAFIARRKPRWTDA